MVLGMFISYSRVFDHMHHWSDVIIGIAVGTSIAFLVVCLFSIVLRRKCENSPN